MLEKEVTNRYLFRKDRIREKSEISWIIFNGKRWSVPDIVSIIKTEKKKMIG